MKQQDRELQSESGSEPSGGQPSWHSMQVEEILSQLETDAENGITEEEADRRLAKHGPNRLPEEAGQSGIVRFAKHFHNMLIYILLIAAAFTAYLGEWIDTGVIMAVVLANAIIGFLQEGKAEKAMEGIRKMLTLDALVLRDGGKHGIEAEDLVPGDIVLLESGDVVPADIRIITARNGRVEEAALTGESQPVTKDSDSVDEDTLLGDRSSMLYSGTLVRSGRFSGVVVETGAKTEIGRIGKMVSAVEKPTTPLLQKVNRFGKQLSVAIVTLGVLLFVVGAILRDYSTAELFLIVVSFAVAAIPEGLPAIMTITLAIGVQRMARRKAIIRKLPAVETLGSVTVICSDKTGTITLNEMMAGRLITQQHTYVVKGTGYEPEGEFLLDDDTVEPDDDPVVSEIAKASILCNDAELRHDESSGSWTMQGDPTDGALLALGEKAGFDRKQLQSDNPRIDEVPFESENRFMVTLNRDSADKRWFFVKGAPERVLEMCSTVRGRDGDTEIRPEEWWERLEEQASDGYRMLAVAVKEAPGDQAKVEPEDVEEGLVLLGVVGLIDPPRPEVVQSIKECHRAGIKVKMITGDHALTARSIAGQVGICDNAEVITGREVEEASDEELKKLIARSDVVARSSPEHKLRLVKALQSIGEVTAMTGDGVNDAPALKQADIGVAMGIKGSEASKRASEMVLADDNFATIERAVEEGRTVFDNLRKAILFILPTNGAESLLVISAVALAFAEMPITPVQILWVNMVTAVTLALALAFEPPEPGIMDRPPRPPGQAVLSWYLVWRIGFVALIVGVFAQGLFLRELGLGNDLEIARTVAVNTLVAGQVFYLFNSRFIMGPSYFLDRLFTNRAALLAVLALIGLQLVFTYVPIFNLWFGTAPLGVADWSWVLVAGVAVFVLVEVEKGFVRRFRGSQA